jgi:hypothetical protein
MALSGSGLATLLGILIVGPLVWGGIYAVRYLRGRGKERAVTAPAAGRQAGEREKLSTLEYIIVLIGYAVGIGNL